MSVTHPTPVRNGIANYVVDLLDAGAGAGTLVVQTSVPADIVTNALASPSYGAAASGTATSNTITDGTCTTAGTAAQFELTDSVPTDTIYGSVGTTASGEDLELSSIIFAVDDVLQVSSLNYIAPL